MQMHSGEIEREPLDRFAKQNDHVDKFQVLEFLTIDGGEIQFEESSLINSTQDNGFIVQSEKFDYLLDLDGNIITAKNGEVHVPINYRKDKSTKIGDKMSVRGKEFIVAGFLRDSQMNSELSSSKRFLISDKDFEEIRNFGQIEYLIEFRLNDLFALGAFETAYTFAELPANGPSITTPLFKTLNAFSDGMMIGVILLISLLIVGVVFMCIRFTLIAKIEDDYREIGVMKAMGLRVSDIKKIYLAKYAAIGLCGCLIGSVLSLTFQGLLTQNIRLNMGESNHTLLASLLGVFGVVLVFFIIMIYVNGLLGRFQKISAVEAIRFGTKQEKSTGVNRFCLCDNTLNITIFLGIKDILARKSLYLTMLAVIIISSFIMIVPENLHNTISDKSFSTYMGIGSCDMRIDIQQTDKISEKADEIIKKMQMDPTISKVNLLTTKGFKTNTNEGIKVELGDHFAFPIAYTKGKAPATEKDIALSCMAAMVYYFGRSFL